jgi:flagellar L-ring protein precursor FlgH
VRRVATLCARTLALTLGAGSAAGLARADDAVSMFDERSYRSLVAESKAFRPGDVLTVLIQENASAVSSADSRAQRTTAVTGTVGSTDTGLHTGRASAGTDSDGGGRTQRSGRLLATLSVRVVEVGPQGELLVQGRQDLRINGEVQAIGLSGLVRPRDIAENNTVPSSRVAEARVEFDGEGFVSDKSKPGWIARLLAALGL